MVNLTINGKSVSVPEGSTILEAARSAGIDIPVLCYYKDIHKYGACRICVVEVEGAPRLQASLHRPRKRGDGRAYQHRQSAQGPQGDV